MYINDFSLIIITLKIRCFGYVILINAYNSLRFNLSVLLLRLYLHDKALLPYVVIFTQNGINYRYSYC